MAWLVLNGYFIHIQNTTYSSLGCCLIPRYPVEKMFMPENGGFAWLQKLQQDAFHKKTTALWVVGDGDDKITKILSFQFVQGFFIEYSLGACTCWSWEGASDKHRWCLSAASYWWGQTDCSACGVGDGRKDKRRGTSQAGGPSKGSSHQQSVGA